MQETGGGLQILKRWDVPWEWQTVSLTSLACGLRSVEHLVHQCSNNCFFFTQIPSLVLIWTTTKINFCPGSFVLTGLVEAAVIPYLGLSIQDLSLDEKAEFLLVAQGYAYHIISSLSPIFKIVLTQF